MNVDGVILVSAQNRINVKKRLELGGFEKVWDITRPLSIGKVIENCKAAKRKMSLLIIAAWRRQKYLKKVVLFLYFGMIYID